MKLNGNYYLTIYVVLKFISNHGVVLKNDLIRVKTYVIINTSTYILIYTNICLCNNIGIIY